MSNKSLLEDGISVGGNIIYLKCLRKNVLKRIAKQYGCSKSSASALLRSSYQMRGDRVICKDGEI